LALRKLAKDYNVNDRLAAMNYLLERGAAGEIVTGLLYVEPEANDLHSSVNTVEQPLNALGEKELCPGSAALEKINAALRSEEVKNRFTKLGLNIIEQD
jgi:2-oxoglutarate ferredoxin oxidoreductase subunit beta